MNVASIFYRHFEEGWITAVKFLMELILVNTLLLDEGLFPR